MKRLTLIVCLLAPFVFPACASVKATANPDGKITGLEYSVFLRRYDWALEETPGGLKVRVGAQSEAEIVQSLLSAAAGAAATLAGKGVIP